MKGAAVDASVDWVNEATNLDTRGTERNQSEKSPTGNFKEYKKTVFPFFCGCKPLDP